MAIEITYKRQGQLVKSGGWVVLEVQVCRNGKIPMSARRTSPSIFGQGLGSRWQCLLYMHHFLHACATSRCGCAACPFSAYNDGPHVLALSQTASRALSLLCVLSGCSTVIRSSFSSPLAVRLSIQRGPTPGTHECKSIMKPCTMATYTYQPLPSPHSIRVATILPGSFDDDITVLLSTHSFIRDSMPQYDAISYAWGLDADKPLINIGDEVKSHISGKLMNALRHLRLFNTPLNKSVTATKLDVNKNLEIALRYLRLTSEPRRVWIDALCINQSDNQEKSIQVARMGEIYQRAARVVAWLGPEAEDSTYGLEFLEAMGLRLQVDWTRWTYEPHGSESATTTVDPAFLDIQSPLQWDTHASVLLSVYRILSRSWFSRLWIRQEIALGNSRSVVQAGLCQVGWDNFRKAATVLESKQITLGNATSNTPGSLKAKLRTLIPLFRQRSKLTILQVGRANVHTECSDPRDRFYALRALMSPLSRSIVGKPDYAKSYEEIYKGIARRYMQRSGLNVLGWCGASHEPQSSLPSWVPQWRSSGVQMLEWPFARASSQIFSHFDFSEDGVLNVAAVIVSTVKDRRYIPDFTQMGSKERLGALGRFIRANETDWRSPYPTGMSRLEAWVRTFITEDILEHVPGQKHPSLSSAMRTLEQLLLVEEKPQHAVREDATTSLRIAGNRSNAQGFFTGSGGYMGTTLMAVQDGDHVCVIVGCCAPLLLRPLAGGRHSIVGRCSVPGIMEGEALLGPLPQHIQMCQDYDESHEHNVWRFTHEHTGSSRLDDPRLSDLPIELREFRQRLKEYPLARIPIEPEILRVRGVDILRLEII